MAGSGTLLAGWLGAKCAERVLVREVEVGGQDADDFAGCVGEADGLADHVRVAEEGGLPEGVGENGDLIVALHGIVGEKRAAEQGRHLEDLEQVRQGGDGADELGMRGAEGQAAGSVPKESQAAE